MAAACLLARLPKLGRSTTHTFSVCVLLCIPSNEQHKNSAAGQRAGTGRGAAVGGPLPTVAKPPFFAAAAPHSRLARSRALRPYAKAVCGSLLPLPGSPLGRRAAVAFSPLRVLPPRFAGLARFGRLAPAPLSRLPFGSPGRSAAPRLLRSARVRRSGSVGTRCRPCALASPRSAVGSLWSPLLCSGSPLRFGSARRVPLSSPPSGLRARGLLARGLGGFAAVLVALPPGSFFVLGCSAPCAFPFSGSCRFSVGSPPAPPARRPPLGGSGSPVPAAGGCGPRSFAAPRGWPVPVKPCALSF